MTQIAKGWGGACFFGEPFQIVKGWGGRAGGVQSLSFREAGPKYQGLGCSILVLLEGAPSWESLRLHVKRWGVQRLSKGCVSKTSGFGFLPLYHSVVWGTLNPKPLSTNPEFSNSKP